MTIDRRTLLAAAIAALPAGRALAAQRPETEIWTFDNLKRIGGMTPRIEGAPRLIGSPVGRAMTFDGVDDLLLLDRHPLANAAQFTFEALIRPDGGAFEQRWFHLESGDGVDTTSQSGMRMLFEIRVEGDAWYLGTFIIGPGYRQALIAPEKRFPLGRWHHVAQSCDGVAYRAYVNGALQTEVRLRKFTPQQPGRSAVGMRMNRYSPFRGALRQAAFTRGLARMPDQFLLRYPA